MQKVISDKVAGIFRALVLRNGYYQVEHELLADEKHYDAADDLKEGDNGFDDEADLEHPVEVFLIKRVSHGDTLLGVKGGQAEAMQCLDDELQWSRGHRTDRHFKLYGARARDGPKDVKPGLIH